MEREIICLGCPNGCHLTATWTNAEDLRVTGAQCDRGEAYARNEIFEPKRVVTAVVRTTSPDIPCVPVKTDAPLLKPLIPQLLCELYRLEVALPVRMGDVLIRDYEKTGVNLVFTRSAAG